MQHKLKKAVTDKKREEVTAVVEAAPSEPAAPPDVAPVDAASST